MAAPEVLPTVLVAPSGAAPRAPGPAAVALKSAAFRAEREASWRELEKLLDQVDRRGVRALSAGARSSPCSRSSSTPSPRSS